MEYYYISAANKAEGPVSAEQLQELLAAGTISSATQIAPVGAQEWQPLNTVISSAPNPGTPLAPPPPQPSPFAQTFSAPAYQPATTPANDPLAITSLVLAILSILCGGPFFSIPAIICGHIARSRARERAPSPGDGLALAGLWVGYVSLVLSILVFLVYIGIFAAAAASSSGLPTGQP